MRIVTVRMHSVSTVLVGEQLKSTTAGPMWITTRGLLMRVLHDCMILKEKSVLNSSIRESVIYAICIYQFNEKQKLPGICRQNRVNSLHSQ